MSKSKDLTRRRMLQGTAALAVSSLIPKSAFAQSNPQPQPTSGTKWYDVSTVNVTTASGGGMPPGFVGLSYEKSNLTGTFFDTSNTALIALFNLLSGPAGGGVLRIGGNSVDTNTYTVNFTSTAISNLAAFLKQTTGWNCIYGINLKGSDLTAPAAGYTTTGLALSEISEVQSTFKTSGGTSFLLGIEMGNEPDAWGTDYDGISNWEASPKNGYNSLWNTYETYVGGTVPYAGPAAAANAGSWGEAFGDYVEGLSPKPNLSVLTQHFYITSNTSTYATVPDLAAWNISNSGDTNGPNVYDFTKNVLSPLAAFSSKYSIPYRLGETNSYYDGGKAGVSNAYVSALWVIDYLFAIAANGGAGANFHGGYTGAYSPLNDNHTSVTVINPIFYGMTFFNMALGSAGGLLFTTTLATFDGVNVSGYTVATSTTTASIILINKDQDWYFQPQITVAAVVTSATLIQLTGTSLASTNVNAQGAYSSNTFIQGEAIGLDGSLHLPAAYTLSFTTNGTNSSTITCWLPLISAVLIKLTFEA